MAPPSANARHGDNDDAGSVVSTIRSIPEKTKSWLTTPSPSHVLIIAVLGSAGGGLALPQEIPILRQFACDWYYRHHPRPASSSLLATLVAAAAGSDTASNRCQIPEIAKLAGEIVTSARVLNAVITVLCLTMYSDMLSRFGRKPMFAFVAFCLTCSMVSFGVGAAIRGPFGMALIVLNWAFSGLGSQPLLQLTFQSYIVDCVKTEERSPTFALLGSATFTGLAISSLTSAGLTKYTNVPLLPFWFGSAFFTLMFLYSVFILPEALTPERREELMAANEATQEGNNGGAKASEQRNGPADGYGSDEDGSSDEEDDSKLDVFSRRFNFFRKLAILLPARDANTGKRDYRLFVLAIAFTIYRIAGLYTNDLLLLTTTGSFGFTGAENGVLVGFITASKAVLLMGILPFVIRHGRTKYAEWTASRSSVHPSGGQSESARLLRNSDRTASYATQNSTLSGSIAGDEDEGPDGSERFDLYFAAASFTVDAIALVGVGSSRAVWQLYASTALLAISAAGGPSVQSISTQIAAKALTDQVLSAFALIDNAGAVLSPLILGSIYSATARTLPSLAWFVSAGLFITAAGILLCMPSANVHVNHKRRRTRRKKVKRTTTS